tara:strand:+ start:7852 stop:8265 length:414 start_codon:yes stop_codon:yes gene_type:complete
MAVTNTGIFVQAPLTAVGIVTAANTTWTSSPDDVVTLLTAGSDGARVHRVAGIPRATITAGFMSLYVSIDGGSNKLLAFAEGVAANTVSTTSTPVLVPFSAITEAAPLILGPADILYAGYSIAVSDGFSFIADYYNY